MCEYVRRQARRTQGCIHWESDAMRIKIVAFLAIILASNAAFAQSEWFRDPALKYKQSTGVSAPGCGPHYWCKDKSEKFLFCPSGFYPAMPGCFITFRRS